MIEWVLIVIIWVTGTSREAAVTIDVVDGFDSEEICQQFANRIDGMRRESRELKFLSECMPRPIRQE